MDLDGDGHDDIISGSYTPGHLYIFHGKGNGEYAKAVEILDASGKKLLAGDPPEGEKYDPHSLASVPYAADMDGDGDYDLLVGNITGEVIYIENEGSATEPAFGSRAALKAGDETIMVPGGDAGPVAVDWTGNGLLDLVVGAGDGSVMLYENTGSKTEPSFAGGVALVEAEQGSAFRLIPAGEEPAQSSGRAKVCVTDYNGDGALDLLVGDFAMQERPAPDLNEDQIARRDELRAEQEEISNRFQEVYEKIIAEVGAENLAEYDITQNEDYMAVIDEMQAIQEELSPLEAGSDYHGWVWLYLRRSAG